MTKLKANMIDNEGRSYFSNLPTFWDFNKSQYVTAKRIGLYSKGDANTGNINNGYPNIISTGLSSVTFLDTSGYAWSWGNNNYGQLGDNTVASRSSPTYIVGMKLFTKISNGAYHAVALNTSGYAWSWGRNDTGQ